LKLSRSHPVLGFFFFIFVKPQPCPYMRWGLEVWSLVKVGALNDYLTKNMARYRLGTYHGSLTNTLLDIQLQSFAKYR
jgi:hypothetical protein